MLGHHTDLLVRYCFDTRRYLRVALTMNATGQIYYHRMSTLLQHLTELICSKSLIGRVVIDLTLN
ncbi:hypothetical protein MnBA_05920 [Marinobacterium sp. BA1]